MLFELENSTFEVILIPASEQKHANHCIRVKASGNPSWFSKFAGNYQSITGVGRKRKRKPTTFIKKRATLEALERILSGNYSGIYAERLISFITREIIKQKQAQDPGKISETFEPIVINGKNYFF